MKVKNHNWKIFGVIAAFVLAYILSVYISGILIDNLYSFQGAMVTAWKNVVIGSAIIIISLVLMNLYAFSILQASIQEGLKMLLVNGVLFLVNIALYIIFGYPNVRWSIVCLLVYTMLCFAILYAYRLLSIWIEVLSNGKVKDAQGVLIVGAGKAGAIALREIQTSGRTTMKAVGFIDDDEKKVGTFIGGVRVLGTVKDINRIVIERQIKSIIIAIPSADKDQIRRITNVCLQTKCKVMILPGVFQLLNGELTVSKMREVKVEDLLGRKPVQVNLDEVMAYIENKTVLVTGGAGSIGSELCRQIATHNPKKLIILDIYENTTYELQQELKRHLPNLDMVCIIASVRDSVKMDDVFKTYRPEIVFHAAAHKHVPLMETSPNEAVKNNVLGTYKTVKCADKYGVEKFVLISTDKAVNPTNIMGATKRICEMIVQAYAKRSKTCFVAVRFGNVLGSNGSVIPLFKQQIEEGGPVTVTHKDIVRYFMTIPEAVSLVLQAGAYAKGGEIFVLDMGEPVKIYELAENLIRLSGYEPHKDIEIVCTGLRPGEKLYEERLMDEEGLQRTDNNRISIGKPIDFDYDDLVKTLDKLYEEVYNEGNGTIELVKHLVPTFTPKK